MATNSKRGGLQPTPEEQARDTLGRHKDDVELRIAQMEKTLAANPISTSMLWKGTENIECAWTEFEAQYDRLRTIAGKGGFKI